MNFRIAAYLYLVLLSFLVIGTVLFVGQEWYDSLWFAVNWAALIIAGVYFATNTKIKWVKYIASMLVGWVFSALCFEVIVITKPELIQTIDKPSATFLWYLIAFIIASTIVTLTHGRETHTRIRNSD